MRNIILILFFNLICITSIYSQRRMTVIKTVADSLHEAANMELEIAERLKQAKLKPKDARNFYSYAYVMSFTKQIDSAYYYLNLALEKDTIWDFFSTEQVLMDADLYFMAQDERWAEIEDEIIKRTEKKNGHKFLNVEKSKLLWKMRMHDQAFYKHIKYAEVKDGLNSPLVYGYWELKKKLNTENLEILEKMIKETGWPKKREVGQHATNSAFYVIQHADLATQKKYRPLMEEAANDGELPWNLLAMLIDRILTKEDKPQLYGTQLTTDKKTGIRTVMEIENPEYVNSRRKKVGLKPLDEHLKRLGIKWDVPQKE